ncbi:unnamed protein product [Lupinus luteus]|uniref:Uncharacterized protein n=1 Tax=Lupinus luteus TaxID=3873 RepID=A0AAV1W6Q4_LUPLU
MGVNGTLGTNTMSSETNIFAAPTFVATTLMDANVQEERTLIMVNDYWALI